MIVSRMDYHPLDSYIVFVVATAAVAVVAAAAAVEYACTAYVVASVPVAVAVAAVEATLFADFHAVAGENSCSHTNPASYYTSSYQKTSKKKMFVDSKRGSFLADSRMELAIARRFCFSSKVISSVI